MREKETTAANNSPGGYYEIRLLGRLDGSWVEWFGGLHITYEGEQVTQLSGRVPDQAALHGLLKKVRDLGLPLLSVNCLELPGEFIPPASGERWMPDHKKEKHP